MTTGKPAPRTTRWTPAQQRSLNAWIKAHPFPPGFTAAPAPKPKPPRTRRPAPGTIIPGGPMKPARSAGINPGGRMKPGRHGKGKHGLAVPGTLPLCAVTAVAESLLAATGIAASADNILALHDLADGDETGAPLAAVLAAVLERGLAGITPLSVAEVLPGDGTVVSAALELAQEAQQEWDAEPSPFWGLHAVYLTEGHALTWGRAVPVTEAFLERQALAAWQITWR